MLDWDNGDISIRKLEENCCAYIWCSFSIKDFSRKPSKFKYFSSLWEPCPYIIWPMHLLSLKSKELEDPLYLTFDLRVKVT